MRKRRLNKAVGEVSRMMAMSLGPIGVFVWWSARRSRRRAKARREGS